MESPLALVLDDDPAVRERARAELSRYGIEALAVATPHEALEMLRVHPSAVVVAIVGDAIAPVQRTVASRVFSAFGAGQRPRPDSPRSWGDRTPRKHCDSACPSWPSSGPVLFAGEAGSGRRHAARCLHALSNGSDPFDVVAPDDRSGFEAALSSRARHRLHPRRSSSLPWPRRKRSRRLWPKDGRSRRLDGVDRDGPAPRGGRRAPLPASLVAPSTDRSCRVPSLRERRSDIAMFVKSIVEDLRRLNSLPPIAVAPDAMSRLEGYAWPGNVGQLRDAVESAVILACDGTIRVEGPSRSRGDRRRRRGVPRRRFRDAKRSVVEAFERSYLEDLLTRHGGNVTGAAETLGDAALGAPAPAAKTRAPLGRFSSARLRVPRRNVERSRRLAPHRRWGRRRRLEHGGRRGDPRGLRRADPRPGSDAASLRLARPRRCLVGRIAASKRLARCARPGLREGIGLVRRPTGGRRCSTSSSGRTPSSARLSVRRSRRGRSPPIGRSPTPSHARSRGSASRPSSAAPRTAAASAAAFCFERVGSVGDRRRGTQARRVGPGSTAEPPCSSTARSRYARPVEACGGSRCARSTRRASPILTHAAGARRRARARSMRPASAGFEETFGVRLAASRAHRDARRCARPSFAAGSTTPIAWTRDGAIGSREARWGPALTR